MPFQFGLTLTLCTQKRKTPAFIPECTIEVNRIGVTTSQLLISLRALPLLIILLQITFPPQPVLELCKPDSISLMLKITLLCWIILTILDCLDNSLTKLHCQELRLWPKVTKARTVKGKATIHASRNKTTAQWVDLRGQWECQHLIPWFWILQICISLCKNTHKFKLLLKEINNLVLMEKLTQSQYVASMASF